MLSYARGSVRRISTLLEQTFKPFRSSINISQSWIHEESICNRNMGSLEKDRVKNMPVDERIKLITKNLQVIV